MRSDKLRRRLAVGLLVLAAGIGVVGSAATASPDEYDWGSAPTVVRVDDAHGAGPVDRMESFTEYDWG